MDRYYGVPPYRETRDYVQKILRIFRSAEHPYDPRLTGASPAFTPPAPARM